ncbi:MAG: hypothetical protein P1P81_02365 [Desulfobulbales bacterium]|nr:hypothetical protein [Desulfobulbales bacterium]
MKKSNKQNAIRKTAICVALSTFYFAMLAYPFGVTGDGYVVERVLLAGALFFAISIPAWIVNARREFFTETVAADTGVVISTEPARAPLDIAQLAVMHKWLTPDEIKQILYCQKHDGMSFDKVAVKRNFLTMTQVKALFEMQRRPETVMQSAKS